MDRGRLAAKLAFAFALAAAAPAGAATTLGDSLENDGTRGGCDQNQETACTEVQTVLPGGIVAAPSAGVITRFRVRNANGTITLKTVRASGGQYSVTGSASPVTVPNAGVNSFPVQLRIAAGELIGVQSDAGGGVGFHFKDDSARIAFFRPPLGAMPSSPQSASQSEGYVLNLQATLEADRDGDGLGDETQDPDRGGAGGGPGGGAGGDAELTLKAVKSPSVRRGSKGKLVATFRVSNKSSAAATNVAICAKVASGFKIKFDRTNVAENQRFIGSRKTCWDVAEIPAGEAPEFDVFASAPKKKGKYTTQITVKGANIDDGRLDVKVKVK